MPPQRNWREKAARVAAMDWDEIRTRLRQEMTKRSDGIIFRFGARPVARELQGTNGHPRKSGFRAAPSPAIGLPPSPGRFFFESSQLDEIKSLLCERFPEEVERLIRRAEGICAHRFDLLGFEGLDYGKVIDWHWDPINNIQAPRKPWYKIDYLEFSEAGDHKIVWELNRHQHLVTLAQAFHLTQQERFLTELLHQWRHWQKENPYPRGINWASSLEVAFRSLAWLWTGRLLAASPAAPKSFQYDLSRALVLSARHIEQYLSTYSSPNTHLLGEATALFFIGTICPQLRSASHWQALGWQVILQEAERQVQADGIHFEQSVYYHVYALDFFLHARILASLNDVPIPEPFDRTLEKMLEALSKFSQAGAPPRFGDDDGGRVFDPRRNRAEHMTDPLSTGAALYHRADFKAASGGLTPETLWLLGPQGLRQFDALPLLKAPLPASTALKTSGFYVMASCHALPGQPHEALPQQLVIDAGPQGTGNSGHGHADALSVQLNTGGVPWLIDPGSFRYISSGRDRDLFRGTAAHNTLQVDGLSQAEPLGPFAWGALPNVRAEHWSASDEFDLFLGSHDGYYRLPQPVLHWRWIFHLKPHFWLVRDVAEGVGEHEFEIFWHFAPSLAPSYTPPGFTMLPESSEHEKTPCGLAVLPVEGHGWAQEFRRSRFSPAYGIEQPAPAIRFATRASTPAEFTAVLRPLRLPTEDLGILRKMKGSHHSAAGYRYSTEKGLHFFLFAGQERPWEFGLWKSDARFVYFGMEEDEERLWVAFCAGSYLEIGGRAVLTADRLVERCEIALTGSREKISCPDSKAVVDANLENLNVALAKVIKRE